MSIIGDSQAWINKDGSVLYAGSQVYNLAPPASVARPTSPLETTLPNGVPAAIILPGQSGGTSDDPMNPRPGTLDNNSSGQSQNLLSIYGTTLTPGAPIVTVPPGPGHTAPLTLSLDSSNNLIYNPSSYALHTDVPPSQLINSALVTPLSTSIVGLAGSSGEPIVILPSGQGISIAGTTIYPASLLATATGALQASGRASMVIAGTTVSLQGTSTLIIGGSRTVDLVRATSSSPATGGPNLSSSTPKNANATGIGANVAAPFQGKAADRHEELERMTTLYVVLFGLLTAFTVLAS